MRNSMVMAAMLPLAARVMGTCKAKVESEKLQADMKTEGLMSHLEELNKIALAHGGNRAFGLPGYDASVDYVYGLVSQYPGAKAWKQDLPGLYNSVESIEFKVGDNSMYVYGLTYSPSTSKEGLTAQLVLGPEGAAACDAANYAGLDVKDKIVLVQRFRCPTGGTLAGRVKPAKAAGAAAVIVYNDTPAKVTGGTLSEPSDALAPCGYINQADGLALKERIAGGESVTAHFQQTQTIETRTTQNVILELEGGDEENVIMLGAHLDSVQAGPGINDDGSGTTLLLELSKALAKYKTQNKVRFAWWGAEENGLVGSKYYCANLPTADVDRLVAYLNFDMVSKGYFGVADTDGSTHGSVAPPGSEVIEKLWVEHFESNGHKVTPAILSNGSDYAAFWQILNKPFGFLHTGTGQAQDPCYHQECDTIENPDPETLTVNAKAAAHMLAILSMNGTELIAKTPVNASMFENVRTRSVGPDLIMIEELEALGERHLGCGHEV
ncbi:peptidase family M28 [Apiospora arundinis]|uniref:Peptide hydrolase n=1 Tax=Apiospora arundinis TaxID=335852 RepID=A0ABR2JC11_9PEZI